MKSPVVASILLFIVSGCGESGLSIDRVGDTPPGFNGGMPLPAWQTAEERRAGANHRLQQTLRYARPPVGTVRTPAEWAPMGGVLVNVPLYGDMIGFYSDLIRGIVDSGTTPYILVDSDYTAGLISSYVLERGGVSRSQVSWVPANTDAFWTRDYGPWHVYLDGQREIVDPYYYPDRPRDDAVPILLGELWDEDVYTAPLYTEGGNFMTDGRGTCWVSDGVLWYNDLTRSQIESLYQSYVGCNDLVFVEPIPGEGTTHIDMFSKVLDEDTILVAYSSANLGATRQEIETLDRAADTYARSPKAGGGRWQIVRIPMFFENEGGYWDQYRVYYAYTNSLIVNDTVLVPTYGSTLDSRALQIYRDAMPGYRVVGVRSDNVIPMGGSVHCTTMQLPKRGSAPSTAPRCGDGAVNGSEQCEAGRLGGASCQSLGYSGGSLSCNSSCTFDTSSCTRVTGPRCGNRVVESGEDCDGNSVSCGSLSSSYISGIASCTGGCAWDTSSCVAASSGPSSATHLQHSDQISAGQWHDFVPIEGRDFTITLTSAGDADLYVKRGGSPDYNDYDCRPYLAGGQQEVCTLDGSGSYHISVNGYDSLVSYRLDIEYRPE